DLGAPPRINRLVVVADAAEVAPRLSEQLQPFVLGLIGVLIFVDQEVAEPIPVGFEDVGLRTEDYEHMQQEVAEVARIQGFQPLLVLCVELGACAGGERFGLPGVDLSGSPAAVLPAVDESGELSRGPAFLVEGRRLAQLLGYAELAGGVE